MISYENVRSILHSINESNVQYCIVEIDEDEKVIEVFVTPDSISDFEQILIDNGFVKARSSADTYAFIYRLIPDVYWENASGITIHSACQMSCVSLSNLSKFKLPLDNLIQESIWANKQWDDTDEIWMISDEDYFIFLISRCIFDQRQFDDRSIRKIECLHLDWSNTYFRKKVEGVFFKFTDVLIQLIVDRKYSKVIHCHRTFVNY